MPGKLLNRIRKDSKRYISKGGFEENIILESPFSGLSIETNGFVTKHWISFDENGNQVNSKNAHICIDEDDLVLKEYEVRNHNDEIDLNRHIVRVPDSTGKTKDFVIVNVFPDETLGLIVCILGDFNDDAYGRN